MPATRQALKHIYSLSLAHVQIVLILRLPPRATIFSCSETWPLRVSASVSSFSLLFVFRPEQPSQNENENEAGFQGCSQPCKDTLHLGMGSEFFHLTH